MTFLIPRLAMADDTRSVDEATQELVGQAESFVKKAPEPGGFEPKKPEIVQKEKEKKTQEADGGPTFVLKEIRLEGNRFIPQKELEPILRPFQNTPITFTKLNTAADLLTEYYQAHGYTTSFAYIPPQKIDNEIAVIKIVEAKIGKVSIENNRYFKHELYERNLHIPRDRVFRYQDLENDLYFLNQKPSRKVRAYLFPGNSPETSNIVLKAEETNPIHFYYDFNNRGSQFTHYGRHALHFDHDNLRGEGDIWNSSFSLAEEGAFGAGAFSYLYPLADEKTSLSLSGNYVRTMLVGSVKSAEIKGEYSSLSPGISYKFIQSPAFTLEGSASFELKDSKTNIDDLKISYDRVRALKIGPRITMDDAGGRTLLSMDANFGLPNFLGGLENEDINSSRLHVDGDFVYYTAGISRIQRLPLSSYLILRAGGQWTDNVLPSIEEFRAGGLYSVRGYPEADSAGDSGYNTTAELNVPLLFLPKHEAGVKGAFKKSDLEALAENPSETKLLPILGKAARKVFRAAAFVDAGKTYLEQKDAPTTAKSKTLIGAGGGLRMDLENNISIQCDVGYPIGDESVEDKKHKQIYVTAKAGF